MNVFNRNNRVRIIKNNAEVDKDYFSNRRWQLVTMLEKYSGFWPYQSKLEQFSTQLVHFVTILILLLAVMNKLREYVGVNTEMITECILTMILLLSLIMKLALASTYQRSRIKIYEKITEHFKLMNDAEEASTLKEFTDQGYKFATTYLTIICVCVCLFDGLTAIEGFYRYLFAHDQLNIKLPVQLNYGFDHKKYWYVVATNFLSSICSGVLIDFAYDLSFILQIRHVQALSKIVGMRLNKATELVTNNASVVNDRADEAYSLISRAIDLHSEFLELVKLIEETHTILWFIILSLSTGTFGAGMYLISTRIHSSVDTLRNVCAYFVILMHFHVIFSQGQNIIDSSSTVADVCYDCKWYGLPGKSCKLLTVMMIRTSVPCRITGAKLFPLSIQTFGKMLKAGISYYTVFKA